MGQTRVIYSDATTAEATSILKTGGFQESNQGGVFTNPALPIKIHVVWGRYAGYPELSAQLDFTPRIQIHIKCRERVPELHEVTLGTASGLRESSPGTRVRVFDVDVGEELHF